MSNRLYKNLLKGNRDWVKKKNAEEPNFFSHLAKGQSPKVLWIGCSDSRVPANEITGTRSGQIFVHRNIANMVVPTDINLLSVVDYAIKILKVEHVIVCGHYGCGGIEAALGAKQYGLIDNWLRNIKDIYRIHHRELEKIAAKADRIHRFTELNIIEQVYNLSKTSTIQKAWKKKQTLELHGWVYDVSNGLIKDLDVDFDNRMDLLKIYRYEF
jgi:carbonic anhydrase